MVYKLSHAERKFLKYVRSTDPLTQLRDCWEWHKDWYTKNGAQIGVFQWIHQGVCCFFFYFIIAATWSGVTGRESKVVTGSKVFVNTASAKVQWDAAAVASQRVDTGLREIGGPGLRKSSSLPAGRKGKGD